MGLSVVALVAGCGDPGTVELTDGWAGSMPPTASNGAIYLTIENGSDDDVFISSVSSSRCAGVELHESRLDDEQVMRMRPATQESRTVAGGETLEMVPGAFHIMCVDPEEAFVVGDQFDVTVTFDSIGALTRRVVVENR